MFVVRETVVFLRQMWLKHILKFHVFFFFSQISGAYQYIAIHSIQTYYLKSNSIQNHAFTTV